MADFHSLPDDMVVLLLQRLPFDPVCIFAVRGTCKRFRLLTSQCTKFDENLLLSNAEGTSWRNQAIDTDQAVQDQARLERNRSPANIPALVHAFGVCHSLQQAPLFALQRLLNVRFSTIVESRSLEEESHRTLRRALLLLPQLREAEIGVSSLCNVALVSALGSRE